MAMAAKTIRLICWDAADAARRAAELRRAGYRVVADPPQASGGMIRAFRQLAPDAVVIDLDRLPSHGRELALGLRASKGTCQLPLIFVGGATTKVEAMRVALPDAIFAAWDEGIRSSIELAMRQPAPPRLASRELPKPEGPGALERKLDIKPQSRFAIVPSRRGDAVWLDELLISIPETAVRQPRIDAKTTLVLYPVRTRAELMQALDSARAALPPAASFWIVHPKQTSPLAAGFNQDDVRTAALALGFVDYKVCAVDKDWSALKFARRGVTKAQPHTMPARRAVTRARAKG
jgi:hypothetical protein